MNELQITIKPGNVIQFNGPTELLNQILYHWQDRQWPDWRNSSRGRRDVCRIEDGIANKGSLRIDLRTRQCREDIVAVLQDHLGTLTESLEMVQLELV